MANLVETIIDRVKVPDKIELAPTDRQLLQKLAESVKELKTKETLTDTQLNTQLTDTEKRLTAQIQELENLLDTADLKHFISEQAERGKYQLKTQMEETQNAASSQLQTIQAAIKDDEILNMIPSLYTQITNIETHLQRQIRTVKILAGFTVWTAILTLAVAVAHVLGYL